MKCIDSSAIVKYLAAESGWEDLKDDFFDSTTIELAVKELSNAFWLKVKRNEVSVENALHVIKNFKDNVVLVDQNEFLDRAFEIAVKYNITIYDSLFITVAMLKDCELITCDARQAEIAGKLGVVVKFYE
jgi:predicted nucleic acid-binding protein